MGNTTFWLIFKVFQGLKRGPQSSLTFKHSQGLYKPCQIVRYTQISLPYVSHCLHTPTSPNRQFIEYIFLTLKSPPTPTKNNINLASLSENNNNRKTLISTLDPKSGSLYLHIPGKKCVYSSWRSPLPPLTRVAACHPVLPHWPYCSQNHAHALKLKQLCKQSVRQ